MLSTLPNVLHLVLTMTHNYTYFRGKDSEAYVSKHMVKVKLQVFELGFDPKLVLKTCAVPFMHRGLQGRCEEDHVKKVRKNRIAFSSFIFIFSRME